MSDFTRVAVLGAGLIGGSAALHLQRAGVDVVVVDADEHTRSVALGRGLAVAETIPGDRDLVLVATPLDAVVAALTAAAEAAPDAVLADLGSVKATPAEAAAQGGFAERYVGLHPMAGSEHAGIDHADADLLCEVTWALTRGSGPVADVVAWVAERFRATVAVLDVAEHDASVAVVSHTPHVVAQALLELLEGADDLPAARHLAAGSFASATRVAGTNPARTFNMLNENREALAVVLDRFLAVLAGCRADLEDPAALRARLEAAEAGADAVRRPTPAWQPCADVAAAVGGTDAILVRHRGSGWETAPV